MLALLDFSKGFQVDCDVSGSAIRDVLSQVLELMKDNSKDAQDHLHARTF